MLLHDAEKACSRLREAHSRIQWLEDEIKKELDMACASLPTGTPLSTLRRQNDDHRVHVSSTNTPSLAATSTTTPHSAVSNAVETAAVNDVSDANLLTPDASGELRYLGASSGAFFASCAAAFVRSSAFDEQAGNGRASRTRRSVYSSHEP